MEVGAAQGQIVLFVMSHTPKIEKIKKAFSGLLNELGFVPVPNDHGVGTEKRLFCIDRKPLICKCDCYGGCSLTESNTRGIGCVYVTGLGQSDLILKTDQFGVRYFKEGTYNKACDYLIITFQGNCLYAIFIDLKTDFEVRDPTLRVGSFEYVSVGNLEKGWQMAGAVVLFESIERLASKIGLIGDYTYKRAFVVIGCVTNKVSVSNGLALPTVSVGPPSEIVNLRNFIWYKQKNNDRIDIGKIIKDAF